MRLIIGGVDITGYIAHAGLKWQRNDIDSSNAGRTLAGYMVRDRVAIKIRLDVKCRPLMADELEKLLTLIKPQYVEVDYDDPMYGFKRGHFYSNNVPASFQMIDAAGNEWWSEVSFPLIGV